MTRTEYEQNVKENHEKVYQMHEAGLSNREIMEKTGYSKSYIVRVIGKMRGSQERRTISEDDRQKILALRKEGKTIAAIAKEVEFSFGAVQRCIKRQQEEEKAKQPVKNNNCKFMRSNAYSRVPPDTVIREIVNEKDLGQRTVIWRFEKQYRHHATFINQYGIRRSFTNSELVQRNIIFPMWEGSE